MKRIVENGGRIYQNSSVIPHPNPTFKGQQQVIYGPHRVFPGRLSVSRTFGDIEAKLPKLDGNPNVVLAEPDITAFRVDADSKFDFILIGCDGIFDKMDNKETIHLIWQNILENQKKSNTEPSASDVHSQCGKGVDCILRTSALRKACDNLTVVIIAFDHFEQYFASPSSVRVVKEDQILEAMLSPLPEQNDILNNLNDIDSLIHKAKQAADLER